MEISDFETLEPHEAQLAKALVKNGFVKQEAIDSFIIFKKSISTAGKPLLGDVLRSLGYVTKKELDRFASDTEKEHRAFVDSMYDKGFITHDQKDMILKHWSDKEQAIPALVSDLNIMTKESYTRLFGKQPQVLRLGEWLIAERVITQEQLKEAVALRAISSLDSFLVSHSHIKKDLLEKIKERLRLTD